MLLFLLAYLGGILTIAGPCILPVLPFLFARVDQPFARSGLPMLLAMAATFAIVATLATVTGGWVSLANQYGRFVALALLALFGAALLFPRLAERLSRPLVALGASLSRVAARRQAAVPSSLLPSVLIGVATGLLWAPCAGPILGLILSTAVWRGAGVQTSLMLLAYGAGAATSLAVALLAGGRAFEAMKRSLRATEWIRRGLGAAVLAAVAAIAVGLDTGLLTNVPLSGETSLEQALLQRLHPPAAAPGPSRLPPSTAPIPDPFDDVDPFHPRPQLVDGKIPLPIEGTLPSLSGAVTWLNSAPITSQQLHGKVVLVDFWTYSCINCLRTVPYLRAWARKYGSHGLVVIGVHTPEFAFEKNLDNVRRATATFGIDYPVAVDSNYALWKSFGNDAWPADYFIDASGRIRAEHDGEGKYATSERIIQQLLAAAGHTDVPTGLVDVHQPGVEAAADLNDIESPETYIGYRRAANFVPGGAPVHELSHLYRADAAALQLNQWSLAGRWTVGPENARLDSRHGGITFRFHARDLHLVLGLAPGHAPVRFQVLLDGRPPGANHGSDTDAAGHGVVTNQRLYQLIRQRLPVADHTFEIRFLDPGVQAYSFTFG